MAKLWHTIDGRAGVTCQLAYLAYSNVSLL